MARRRNITNEKLAPNLVQESLNNLQRLLSLIGKPFYLVILYSVFATLFLTYITGYSTRILLTFLSSLSKSIFKLSRENYLKLRTRYQKKFTKASKNLFKHSLFTKYKKGLTKIWQKQYKKLSAWWSSFVEKFASFVVFFVANAFSKAKLLILKLKLRFQYFLNKAKQARFPKLHAFEFSLVGLVLTFLVAAAGLWMAITYDLPSPEELTSRKVDVSTKIYDRNGVLLYKIYKDQNRTPVALSDIPPQVKYATLAVEDADFYSHPGFSVKGMLRAAIKDLRSNQLTGGSTITQQLVKNTLLSPEKTIMRKLREIVLAVQVEMHYSKDQILEMYLNQVAYGGTAYGIQEAAKVYFNKDVKDLTLAEAAILAGLPKSPTTYSPFGPNPELAKQRQKEVLNLMYSNGFITKEQREKAEKETLVFAPNHTDIKAPHFVMYVRQLLVDKYGEEVVDSGGLEVVTTLDYSIQKMAEQVVKDEVNKIKGLNVSNGAAIVIDPKSGEILAMVGSKDYFDSSIDGKVNVAVRPRQPGSSIKVINYSYALSHGYTPATILADTPVTFYVQGQPPYTPKDYDDRFRGNIPLRGAFAESRNIPAVKVLASYGVNKMIEQGRKMGITTWTNPDDYGLSLTLGGGEVKLIDLARVYATVADYGQRPDISSIIKVTNYKGKILEENNCQGNSSTAQKPKSSIETVSASQSALVGQTALQSCSKEQVLDPRVAYLLIDILKDDTARAPAFGRNSLLVIPGHPEVAVKTGTSNDLRDNLTLGFNQNYLVAVWVGNNDNSPMSRVASGITGASPIFNEIMTMLLTNNQSVAWNVPTGLSQVPICTFAGTLPCDGCPTRLEWFLDENKPQFACSPDKIKQVEEKNKEKSVSLGLVDYSR